MSGGVAGDLEHDLPKLSSMDRAIRGRGNVLILVGGHRLAARSTALALATLALGIVCQLMRGDETP